jgi:hypothetical protein
VVGTVLWFGLIVVDATRNPVTAKYAPDLVHTPADLDAGSAIISLPALLVFPVGYALLAQLLIRHGARWPGLLVGVGAVVYWSAAIPLLTLGPQSPVIQVLEVAGAVPYAVGLVLLGWRWAQVEQPLGQPASGMSQDPSPLGPQGQTVGSPLDTARQ